MRVSASCLEVVRELELRDYIVGERGFQVEA